MEAFLNCKPIISSILSYYFVGLKTILISRTAKQYPIKYDDWAYMASGVTSFYDPSQGQRSSARSYLVATLAPSSSRNIKRHQGGLPPGVASSEPSSHKEPNRPLQTLELNCASDTSQITNHISIGVTILRKGRVKKNRRKV